MPQWKKQLEMPFHFHRSHHNLENWSEILHLIPENFNLVASHAGGSMWSSCCNWFCLDSATVEDRGGARPEAYANSSYTGYPSPSASGHICKACRGRFSTLTRKHICVDCRQNFCDGCCVQLEQGPRLCHTCLRFHGALPDRAKLMKFKVKDLRDYLHLHGVSTQTCREKEELVDLVLGHRSPASALDVPLPGTTVAPPAAPAPVPPPASPVLLPPASDVPTEVDLEPLTQEDNQSLDSEDAGVPGRRASLSDLSGPEDIEALSVRQLKEILARNFVDYKGCCEKWELMERVRRLYREQQDLQNLVSRVGNDTDPISTPSQEENLCKICMDSPIDCVLLECGHMVTCTKCGKRMSECPICRQYVIRAVHVFRS
ncbi:E3 ubiquitin-protein ligase rififylin-like isoform X2 [Brienomyrus brachyistius]|uniref:E3 ubiquitin-protein ligase rififylin-like isoform X2 n=1 Tax=Brienomyrus brachyistius TaxID=42636 RepID=UPI0020B19F7B|nr:E3 ubiquitin-protein ligase rififylin-like isoform X2 [Brienomyrus brachyistius]